MDIFYCSKRSFSFLKNESASLQPTDIARQRVGVFVRQGKKEKIEKSIRSIVFTKTKNDRSAANRESNTSKISVLFRSFTFSATPFVTLKRRRRGKRPSIKVGHISRVRGSRKALQTLSSAIRSGSSKSNSFSNALARQLDARSTASKRSSSSTNNDRRDRRDSIHKQAASSRPPH